MVSYKSAIKATQMGLLLLGLSAALLSLVLSSLLFKHYQAQKSSSPIETTQEGYLEASSCCRYTHAELPALIRELATFELETVYGNLKFAHLSQDWRDFASNVPDLETPRVNNSYLRYLDGLRTRVKNVMASNRDSLEDMNLQPFVNELDYVLNLTDLDAYFLQTGIYWWDYAWIDDPWATAADTLALLPEFASQPDFASRVLLWLAQLDDKADRWRALAERSLALGKVHANITLVSQYDLGFGVDEGNLVNYGHVFGFRAQYSAFCTLVFANASVDIYDVCVVYATSLEAKLAALDSWWTTVYIPAAASLRPNQNPGLRALANGDAIYATLQRYHLGQVLGGSDLYALGETQLAEVLGNYTALAPVLLGNSSATAADLIAALADPDDTRFYLCTNDTNEAMNAAYIELGKLQALLPAQFGFLSRAPLSVTVSGSPATYYQPGVFDARRKFWTTSAQYNVGRLGRCNLDSVGGGPFYYYDKVGLASTAAHEGVPGHHLQISLLSEIECAFTGLLSANTATVEGWGLFAEFIARELGAYSTPLASLGNYLSRALRDNRLREDACLHSSDLPEALACNTTQASALMRSVGFSADYADSEMRRYIVMPAQALGYRAGDLALQALRRQLSAQVPSVDSMEFTNLFLRFGGPDVGREFPRLIDVYVRRALGQSVGAGEFGADLIPAQLYSTGNPNVGLGRDASCVISTQ